MVHAAQTTNGRTVSEGVSRPSPMPAARAGVGRYFVGPSAYFFLLPSVLLFIVFVAYPVLWVMGESLYAQDPTRGETFAGLGNYLAIFSDPVFWIVARNMLLWGAITIPVQMLIGGTIAWFIERHTHRWRGFFRTMFFLPVVTSVSVISLVWIQIYAPYYGIAQEYLNRIGIEMTTSPIGEPGSAIFALILVNVWQWTGFSMLMYIAGLANLPAEVIDAARVDGAGGLKLARWVIVPMLAPVTKSLLLLGIIGTLQTFPIVHLMTGGGPNHASEIFGTYIFKQSFVLGNTGIGATLSVIVLMVAFLLSVAQIYFLGASLVPAKRDVR
jgi:ABC-type sugar transport system permease subunit